MSDPNEVEKIEAEDTQPEAPDLQKEVAEFHERKEVADAEIKKIKTQNNKAEKKVKPKPEVSPSLEQFRDKLVKDFGIVAKVEPSSGNTILRYNKFLIIKLLPRKNCRFGICREVPEEDNKWKAFRIKTEDEETAVYNHVKKLVELNKPEAE